MSVDLGSLYHWSPRERRESILRNGLRIMERCSDGTEAWFPWVCLGTTPSTAWGLLPGGAEYEAWDLWQVRVSEGDTLEIRGDFSPYVREVRVMHGLGPDRVWFVGTRDGGAHTTEVA